MKSFKIRQAKVSDSVVLLGLIKELAEFEKLSHEVIATGTTLKESLFGKKKVAEALIGEYEGVPVAFAIYFYNYSTFLACPGIYLEDLYVQPKWRSRGFGREILSYIARKAVAEKCGRLEWSVLDWNEKAIDFYKRLGASPMNEWSVFRLTGKSLEALGKES